MTLTKPFVKAYLLDSLQPFLAEQGFEAMASRSLWRKPTPAGFQSVVLSVSEYEDTCFIEFHLGVRINAVEELIRSLSGNPRQQHDHSHTLIVSHGKLMGRPFWRFHAENTDYLDQVAEQFRTFWSRYGAEFLHSHERLDQVEEALNLDPGTPCAFLPNQADRCLKGLASAWLAQSQDLPDLISSYQRLLPNIPGAERVVPGFQKLTLLVRHSSLN